MQWSRAHHATLSFTADSDCTATIASGIRVPAAVGDFMILNAVRESGGRVLATPD